MPDKCKCSDKKAPRIRPPAVTKHGNFFDGVVKIFGDFRRRILQPAERSQTAIKALFEQQLFI